MTSERDPLSKFRDAFLDYLEGHRDEPLALEDLPYEQRSAAEAFVKSITAARGVDPYASRPSVEQLLAQRSQTYAHTGEFSEALQNHLRLSVDPKASVTSDAASAAEGLASTLVIWAHGMRIRVVPETNLVDLEDAITGRAEGINRVFNAFPDSDAVLYTTAGNERLGVVVDRGDVCSAIETPSGEIRSPRLRRPITDAATACEKWLTAMVPEFKPLGTDLFDPKVDQEPALDALRLASMVVDEVSTSGARARIEAKRATWRDFGTPEAHRLTAIVQEALLGELSEENYRAHLDQLVEMAA